MVKNDERKGISPLLSASLHLFIYYYTHFLSLFFNLFPCKDANQGKKTNPSFLLKKIYIFRKGGGDMILTNFN